MARCIVSRILVCVLLVTTVLGYVDIGLTSGKTEFSSYFQRYVLTGNYTVDPDINAGVFSVDQMELSDNALVILFTKANASSITSREPCLYAGPDPNILRVYTNQTRVYTSGAPDVYPVESDSVFCYMVINEREYENMGLIKFSYKDTSKRGTKKIYRYATETAFRRKTFDYYSTRACYHPRMNQTSMAVDYVNRMTDKTSMDRVGISLENRTLQRQNCRSLRCPYVNVTRYYHLSTVTPQTPGDIQQWPLVVNGTAVCFHFENIRLRGTSGQSAALFRVSEFPIFNGTITSSNGGVIASPGYPKHPYEKNLSCNWTIQVLPGQTIAAEFEDAESDCSNDYVQLSGLEGGRRVVCGPSMTGQRFLSTTNSMNMTFKTNVYAQLKGFLLRFNAIGCSLRNLSFPQFSKILNEEKPDVIKPGYRLRVGCYPGYVLAGGNDEVVLTCIADRTWSAGIPFCVKYPSCKLTLTEPRGSLASPGYPGYYPKSTTCSWKIRAKFGQRIKLRLDHITSDCDNDYIIIGGLSQSERNLTVLTPKKEPQPRNLLICGQNAKQGSSYTSQTHEMTVRFQSGLYRGEGYFNMTYQAIGCRYDSIRRPANSMITNEANFYPAGYKLEVECHTGYRFPVGKQAAVLTCMVTGTWKGRVPLCVRSQDRRQALRGWKPQNGREMDW